MSHHNHDLLPVNVCGVAVVEGTEFPCLLPDQHEGFCDLGLDFDHLRTFAKRLQTGSSEPPGV